MASNFQLDNLDRSILSVLMRDGRTPYTEIAQNLLVSAGTIHVRMKRMEKLGIVKGVHLLVDPKKIGFDVTSFIGVFLEKGTHYKDVIKEMEAIPEITETYYTTGGYSMFLKVICQNTDHFRQVLNDKIQAIKGVQRTESMISLEQSINRQVEI